MKFNLKNQLQYLFFILLAVLAFYAVFKGNDLGLVWQSVLGMNKGSLILSALDALVFTMIEGLIIWYLLRSLKERPRFRDCLRYSFVGFLYSGITPSASGGQPMQLYHMSRDGNGLSASTVVLMTVALIYKLVLVLMGIAMVLFGFPVLKANLGKYLQLFYLGMFLNTVLVLVLLLVMFCPQIIQGAAYGGIRLFHMKNAEDRKAKVDLFISRYHTAVIFLAENKKQIVLVLVLTFIQRCLVFILPYIVYRGFGLSGTGPVEILMIQMSIYLAVDMLPLPGAQGITELMYRRAFRDVFGMNYVVPSMCVSRGISFYFLLFFSMAVCVLHSLFWRKAAMK